MYVEVALSKFKNHFVVGLIAQMFFLLLALSNIGSDVLASKTLQIKVEHTNCLKSRPSRILRPTHV